MRRSNGNVRLLNEMSANNSGPLKLNKYFVGGAWKL